MGLKKSTNRTYINVVKGELRRSFKNDETEEWDHESFGTLEHQYLLELNVVEKTDFDKSTYKELQATLRENDDIYILAARLFKPFTDGLLLSLANADLSHKLTIKPYLGKDKSGTGQYAPTYCVLIDEETNENIRWIDGAPAIEYIEGDEPGGKMIPKRKERNEFLINLIDEINENTKSNKETYEESLKGDQEVYPESDEDLND